MKGKPAVVADNKTLFDNYHQLRRDDIICGRIRLRRGEEPLLCDLTERGVRLIPSATSQLLSRSKVLQARVLDGYMLPGTRAIYEQYGLLRSLSRYSDQDHPEGMVLKRDDKNSGVGIHYFRTTEELYNHVSGGGCPFPFVIQPFVSNSRDIRIMILDQYVEAYERHNAANFRNNLGSGGTAQPYHLDAEQLHFCRQVMARAHFPYAHIDLLLGPDGRYWLAEINLRGGLKGARIGGREYREKVAAIEQGMVTRLLG